MMKWIYTILIKKKRVVYYTTHIYLQEKLEICSLWKYRADILTKGTKVFDINYCSFFMSLWFSFYNQLVIIYFSIKYIFFQLLILQLIYSENIEIENIKNEVSVLLK